MRLPTRKSENDRHLLETKDHFYTPERIERMKSDIERLKKERPAAADEVHRTAQMGDLSENAGYQEAKTILRRINSRLLTLEDELKHAVPIQKSASDTIALGSTVHVRSGTTEQSFTLVGSHEVNITRGRISYISPLGSGLLGHKAGDEVEVEIAGKKTIYRILRVS